MESLYTITVNDASYINLIDDVMRMVTLQATIQFLYFMNNPEETPFWTADFVLLILYVILGVCMYWLVVKRIVRVSGPSSSHRA